MTIMLLLWLEICYTGHPNTRHALLDRKHRH